MRPYTLTLLTLLLSACDYIAPLDPNAQLGTNTISGTIVLSGTHDVAPVMVLIYDVNDPPPPTGTGRPISIATVPTERFNTSLDGLLAAPYAVPYLPDGAYLVTALMDTDHDFHPLIANGSLAGATCGDWLGAYVSDVLAPNLTAVSVTGGQLQQDVTIAIATESPLERPAFVVPQGQSVNRALAGSSPNTPQVFQLDSTAIYSSAGLELTGPFTGTDLCDTAFHILVQDLDGDGRPDPHPDPTLAAMGLYDIWPRIYLQHLGEPDGAGGFITDMQEGESYLGQGVVFPSFLATGSYTLNTPMLVDQLNVMWLPAAIHEQPNRDNSVVTNPLALPDGAWAVSVISFTGQTWTVPNALAAYESTDLSYAPQEQLSFLAVE